ncbi:MAG: CinA family protein [Clostridia bacterium]|nr:CinA family protein [Clostridia bacterium]MDE7328750.1 CinA family protein [Clostridia bacterium]
MIETCKNYCVLKAFDIDSELLSKCKELANVHGVSLEYAQRNLDCKITLVNKSASDITYQNILDGILEILKSNVYANYDTTLEQCLIENARNKGAKIAVAESLTGGMICSRLVDVPGSSSVLYEGFVTYDASAKVRRLHVKLSTIEQYGVVSEEVAKEMVQGLLENKEIDYAIATTGCAGPQSDEYDTPVGLSYIAIGGRDKLQVFDTFFDKDRNEIRKCVTNTALYLALRNIKEL